MSPAEKSRLQPTYRTSAGVNAGTEGLKKNRKSGLKKVLFFNLCTNMMTMTIRKITVLLFISIATISSGFPQPKQDVSAYMGLAGNALNRFADVVGGGSSEGKLSLQAGIRYSYPLSSQVKLVSGLDYGRHNLVLISAPLPEQHTTNARIRTLSLPAEIQWHIGNWFFIRGGPAVDVQLENDGWADHQDGIGFSAGVGGRYPFGNWSVFLMPSVKQYGLIPFRKEPYHQRLMTMGVMVGVGYRL